MEFNLRREDSEPLSENDFKVIFLSYLDNPYFQIAKHNGWVRTMPVLQVKLERIGQLMALIIEITASLQKDPEIMSEKRNLESFLDYYLNNPLFKGKKLTHTNFEIKKFLKNILNMKSTRRPIYLIDMCCMYLAINILNIFIGLIN